MRRGWRIQPGSKLSRSREAPMKWWCKLRVGVAFFSLLVTGMLACASAADTYRLGGLDGSTYADSLWSFNGTYLAAYRAAITNSANFGASGTSPTTIIASNLSTINATTLGGLDGLILPYIPDSALNASQLTD